MSRNLLVVAGDAAEQLLQEVTAAAEQALHERLRRTSDLLPLEALGLDGPMLVVGLETSLDSGRIDLVGLTRSGELLLIVQDWSAKSRFPCRTRRAARLRLGPVGSTVEGFDNAVVRRYLASSYCTEPAVEGATTLVEAVHRFWPDIAHAEVEALQARLSDVLDAGQFHFVVVAQRFTPSMENTMRYLDTAHVHAGAGLVLLELGCWLFARRSAVVERALARVNFGAAPGPKLAELGRSVEHVFCATELQ